MNIISKLNFIESKVINNVKFLRTVSEGIIGNEKHKNDKDENKRLTESKN